MEKDNNDGGKKDWEEIVNCDICKFSGDFHGYDAHISSDMHLLRAKVTNFYYCKMCDSQLTGETPYKQHITGKIHAKSLDRLIAESEMRQCMAVGSCVDTPQNLSSTQVPNMTNLVLKDFKLNNLQSIGEKPKIDKPKFSEVLTKQMPIPSKANQQAAYQWMENHIVKFGFKVRSAALIDSKAIFENSPKIFEEYPIQELTKLDIIRKWSFNFEKEDGSRILLDDPKIAEICKEIGKDAIICDLLQIVIWHPKKGDRYDIGQLILKNKM